MLNLSNAAKLGIESKTIVTPLERLTSEDIVSKARGVTGVLQF
jgi:hypothetical protein